MRAEHDGEHRHWVVLHHGDSHTVCDPELARRLYATAAQPKAVAKVPPGLIRCPREVWAELLGPAFTAPSWP